MYYVGEGERFNTEALDNPFSRLVVLVREGGEGWGGLVDFWARNLRDYERSKFATQHVDFWATCKIPRKYGRNKPASERAVRTPTGATTLAVEHPVGATTWTRYVRFNFVL